MGHEALLVVNAPPNMAIDVAGRGRVDGYRCPVLEAGDNLCRDTGLLADVSAPASRHLDLVFVAEDRVQSALLATDNGRIGMPACGIGEQVHEARGTAALASVSHLDVRRIKP